MGSKSFRSMDDFARHGCASITVVCDGCGRQVTFATAALLAFFTRRGLTTTLPWAGRYFVCRGRRGIEGCGHRGARLLPSDWDGPPDPGPPTPLRERVPAGVDRDAWARADDRERKRLIRRARG